MMLYEIVMGTKNGNGDFIIFIGTLLMALAAFWGTKIKDRKAREESREQIKVLKGTITEQSQQLQRNQELIKEQGEQNLSLNTKLAETSEVVKEMSIHMWNLLDKNEKTLIISQCTLSFTLAGLSSKVQEYIKRLIGKPSSYSFLMYQEKDGKIVSEAKIDIRGTWEEVFKHEGSIYKYDSFVYDLAQVQLKIFDSRIYLTSGMGQFNKTLPLKFKPEISTLLGTEFNWSNGIFILGHKGDSAQAKIEKHNENNFIGTFNISKL